MGRAAVSTDEGAGVFAFLDGVTILSHTAKAVAEVRLQDAGLSAHGFALASGLPYSTAARMLAAWFALGVPGVERVPSRARGGLAYRVAPDLPARWLACELPAPRLAA